MPPRTTRKPQVKAAGQCPVQSCNTARLRTPNTAKGCIPILVEILSQLGRLAGPRLGAGNHVPARQDLRDARVLDEDANGRG